MTTIATLIWVRAGDAGEYESFDGLDEAVEYLNELGVGRVDHWINGGPGVGIDTANHHGHDFISLFHGDADANLVSSLLPDERVFVEDALRECQP